MEKVQELIIQVLRLKRLLSAKHMRKRVWILVRLAILSAMGLELL
jgi:predicted DNA-binding protein (MmcQ/YjbR family)